MDCPYFRASYFGICVAPNSVHVPSIDEMERLCFRSSYINCPNLSSAGDSLNTEASGAADDGTEPTCDQILGTLFESREKRGARKSLQ